MTPEQLTIIRQIRKTSIVLIVMFNLCRPTGETEIGRILELSSKSARDKLDSLERLGLVVRRGRFASFELTPNAFELGLCDPSGKIYRSSGNIYRSPIIINELNNDLNNSDSIKTIKTLTREDHNARNGSGKNFPSSQAVDKPVDNPVDKSGITFKPDPWDGIPQDLAKAFREARLLPNQLIRNLAQQEHITPEYVRAHYQDLVERGRGGQTGLLVKILEAGTPAPETNSQGHAKNCTCHKCYKLAYLSWED
jgi:hypothetical protein